jgi:ubiquinone/menaquinone biosynthesis C-methylase UbiE
VNQTKNSLEDEILIVGEPWADSPYYDDAERWTHVFWTPGTEFRRMFDKLDLTEVVELACGHGRHAATIANQATHITLMDIFDSNLDFCKKRLENHKNVSFLKGDGGSFRPLMDASVTSIFCYDAMVHFSPEIIRSYLVDTARVLKPGGKAFFHHSNYPAPLDQHYGLNPHARNHMTASLFSTYATAAGLDIVESKIIPWGEMSDLDCLTLVAKPNS